MSDIIVKNEYETAIQAQKLAKSLKKGDILCIYGTLGAGKTSFCREIIRFLTKNPLENVPSPTFSLIQTYETDQAPVFHYDLYRIEDSEEIFELGWDESLASGITLVEWPERLGPYLPERRKDITINTIEGNENARTITIEARP